MVLIIALFAQLTASTAPDAEAIYMRDFQGEFAPQGACARITERWVFTEREITQGALTCTINGHELHEGHSILSTTDCTMAGEVLPARSYSLDLRSENVVIARVGEQTLLLDRCPQS